MEKTIDIRKIYEDYCAKYDDREQKCYIAELIDEKEAFTVSEMAYYINISVDRCARLCLEMLERGELVYIGNGQYTTPDKVED